MDLTGYALVTGAGSGIGRDACLAYALEGVAGILIADIDWEATQDTLQECKRLAKNPMFQSHAYKVDVSVEASVLDMVAFAVQTFGRIDYCVNSAGISSLDLYIEKGQVGVEHSAEISESSLSEFERFWRVNVQGMFLCLKAQSAAMKKQERRVVSGRRNNSLKDLGRGVIINLGSCNSYVAIPGMIQYTTSKHAVLGMTRNAALDNAPYGIRVNALCPGWVKSPMVDRAMAGNKELGSFMERVIPMKRIADAEEISDTIMFLSSGRSSYVTGADWIVDGGTTLTVST